MDRYDINLVGFSDVLKLHIIDTRMQAISHLKFCTLTETVVATPVYQS